MATKALKQVPNWRTDEEADRWLQEVNLADYDLGETESLIEWLRREASPKTTQLNIRVSHVLKHDLDDIAKKLDVPTQKLARSFLEAGIRAMALKKTVVRRRGRQGT